jgi:hypothetical protein
MGNYSAEGNYEYKNVTDKPLGEEWNSKGSPSSLRPPNATNDTSLAHHAHLLA